MGKNLSTGAMLENHCYSEVCKGLKTQCQCQFLQVTLFNEVLAEQSENQGEFELFATINGKPSWKSATQAIWYIQANKGKKRWLIGNLANIGTKNGGIVSYSTEECPQLIAKKQWLYWDNKKNWKKASPNDMSVQCIGKKI